MGLKPPYTLAVELRRIFFNREGGERRKDGGKRRGARRGSWRKNGNETHLTSITEALQGDLYTCTWTCLCDAVTACSSLNSQEYILHLIHAPRQTGLGLARKCFISARFAGSKQTVIKDTYQKNYKLINKFIFKKEMISFQLLVSMMHSISEDSAICSSRLLSPGSQNMTYIC